MVSALAALCNEYYCIEEGGVNPAQQGNDSQGLSLSSLKDNQ